jgi:hypothetical protein
VWEFELPTFHQNCARIVLAPPNDYHELNMERRKFLLYSLWLAPNFVVPGFVYSIYFWYHILSSLFGDMDRRIYHTKLLVLMPALYNVIRSFNQLRWLLPAEIDALVHFYERLGSKEKVELTSHCPHCDGHGPCSCPNLRCRRVAQSQCVATYADFIQDEDTMRQRFNNQHINQPHYDFEELKCV